MKKRTGKTPAKRKAAGAKRRAGSAARRTGAASKKRGGPRRKQAASSPRPAPTRATARLSVRRPEGLPDADPTPRDADSQIELRQPPELIEPPSVAQPFAAQVHTMLARLEGSELLEALYDDWLELRLSWRRAAERFAGEQRRLEEQGALLLGALGAAGTGPEPGLITTDEPQGFARVASARLAEAMASLESQRAEARQIFDRALAQARQVVQAQVERRARAVRPRMSLMVRTLPNERRVLHARRPEPDEAVTLHTVITGRIPSRYGFLFDDSTDDVAVAPAMLYAEEGVEAGDVRPRPQTLRALLDPLTEVWPTKGALPMWLTRPGGEVRAVRWLERGPVMEAEVEEGDTWRNVLTREEAEAITGALLALKLEGKLELELVRG